MEGVAGRKAIHFWKADRNRSGHGYPERKRAEEALREREERLQFALEAAGAGTWELSLEAGELRASDKALHFLGIAPGAPVTHEMALARVHPDDRSRLENALRHTFETGQPFILEWRVPFRDGSVRWREARGERRSVSGKQLVAGAGS